MKSLRAWRLLAMAYVATPGSPTSGKQIFLDICPLFFFLNQKWGDLLTETSVVSDLKGG